MAKIKFPAFCRILFSPIRIHVNLFAKWQKHGKSVANNFCHVFATYLPFCLYINFKLVFLVSLSRYIVLLPEWQKYGKNMTKKFSPHSDHSSNKELDFF